MTFITDAQCDENTSGIEEFEALCQLDSMPEEQDWLDSMALSPTELEEQDREMDAFFGDR